LGSDEGVSRRDLLKKAGLGGAVLLGGSLVGSAGLARARSEDTGYEHQTVGDEVLEAIYEHDGGTPIGIDAEALTAHTFPPPRDGRPPGTLREVEITVEDRLVEVANGVTVQTWTYGGSVPGPTLRATEGDLLRIRLVNRTGRAHNLHLHGAHRPEHDGWEPVPSMSETVYEIEAGPAGVHPYHCHLRPLAEHVARGLYGTLIVDPPGGRSPAQEVTLLLSGFSDEAIGRNGVVAWNGVAGFYHTHPIKISRDEPVRAYVVNMLEYEPLASFHLHAQTFDVYPAGMGDHPAHRDDTVALAMGQRAMLEFTLPDYGRYMFHPHQHWLAERGATGWFAAV
jgi:FtsP/CotA-like multicopper oxidase with cupredoxin domain